MKTIKISRRFKYNDIISPKCAKLMKTFGIDRDIINDNSIEHKVNLTLKPGQICYIFGPSGSGKSVVLDELYEKLPDGQKNRIEKIPLPQKKAVIDTLKGPAEDNMRLLSSIGLGDIFNAVTPPAMLSQGQKFRYRLAKALQSNKQYIVSDEYCSSLDPVTAAAIAHRTRVVASKRRLTFVLAGYRTDILKDLRPDIKVIKPLSGSIMVLHKNH